MKPEDWRPGSVDAIATRSADGRRIVIKAVNYEGQRNTLYVRLQGGAFRKGCRNLAHDYGPAYGFCIA